MNSKCEDYSCADDCDLLAEMEKERDTWARVARIVIGAPFVWRLFPMPEWTMGDSQLVYSARVRWTKLAAAYAIAEAYGKNWRLGLEAKPVEDI
jgi:hypothetical protein